MQHWPHSPPHWIQQKGIYMVTAGTYQKENHFKSPARLSLLQDSLLQLANEYGWELHAWAILSNHYHFMGRSLLDPSNLRIWIAKLHRSTASAINLQDNMPNRKVWYEYWDSMITNQRSYLARLNYIHNNPVKHGLIGVAANYPWCSASQFEANANHSFVRSVYSFNYDKVNVPDNY